MMYTQYDRKILGVSEGFHDAAVTLLHGAEIVHASHSERYSKIKNDHKIHPDQYFEHEHYAYYEKNWLKNTRRVLFGQSKISDYKCDWCFDGCSKSTWHHHKSHAAAGFYTSPFDKANVLVIDSIGEWDTISVWEATTGRYQRVKMEKKKSWKYPYSLGLFYSAVTQRVGLKPNEDEYILMGMAAYGEPIYDMSELLYRNNHKGIGNYLPHARNEDLAASAQATYERELLKIIDKYCTHPNLVFMGGCALNCSANSKISGKNIWIMPSPGDAGSSLGAAALAHGKKLEWKDPYLGYNIDRMIDPKKVAKYIVDNSYCGVANGRAEFGPRALGNRSLLADPRKDIKDTVNQIKRRQLFRPFAPAILEEHAEEYFEGPMNEYMQFVAKAKHDYDSVTHVDGTARVQVVKPDCSSVIRPILEEFYALTGVPMLLNTSLNIKGKPMVNDESDAVMFQTKYDVKVFY
jgi:carbamoyltransferase